jgi:two-component system sensor histidine kinase SenX3
MESTWLVLVALALGLVVGAGLVAVLQLAARHGARVAGVVNPVVPDGVDQMLDALESAGLVLDPSNNVVKASPGAFALGLVSGRALNETGLTDVADTVRSTGVPVTVPYELVRGIRGEASRQLSVRAAVLGARYVLLLADDHTESLRLDAVRRDFIANVSHELKTPIGAIALLTEALESCADDADQVRAFTTQLSGETARLSRITQDIIELSRLQSTDAAVRAERIDIDEVVSRALDQNRITAGARSIDLVAGKPSGAHVYGDDALLVAAVDNLISNAIRYSPDGSRVGVGVRASDDAVEISITDQGEGIPAADLDRVFERFYRVDSARSRHTGGSGLGLAITKHAVENHGGSVRAWSKLGSGSTFTIRLPLAADTADTIDAQGVM